MCVIRNKRIVLGQILHMEVFGTAKSRRQTSAPDTCVWKYARDSKAGEVFVFVLLVVEWNQTA